MSTRKQEEHRHEIKVGLTILVGLAIVIFVIFAIGRQQGVLEKRYVLYVYMSRVNGLQTGAPVRLNGVRVGSVIGIEFTEQAENQRIKVTLEIMTNVQNLIRTDSEAYIGTLGLLGDKFISITSGLPHNAILQSGDQLIGTDPVDVEKLIDESVNTFDELRKATAVISEIAEKINSGQGTIGLLVNDPQLYNGVTGTLKSLQQLKKEFENSDGTIARILRDTTMYSELYTFLRNANLLADSLVNGSGSAAKFVNNAELYDKIVNDLNEISTLLNKINRGEGTFGQMINDDELYRQLQKTTAQLDSLVKDVRMNPKRYLTVKVF